MRLIEEISEEEAQAMAEQGPRPENLPAGMSLSEEAEFDRLKEKYSHHQRQRDMGPGPTTEEGIIQAQKKMDEEFRSRKAADAVTIAADVKASRVKPCFACKGMRFVTEEYNHRVMQRDCDTCGGEGVLVDGKPMEEPVPKPKEAPTDLFKPGQAAAVRRGLLFKRKEKLEARKEKYAEEVVAAQAKLEESTAEHEQLLADLLHHIGQQMTKLNAKIDEIDEELKNVDDGEGTLDAEAPPTEQRAGAVLSPPGV